jgi:putative proteasome-type protease
MTYCLGIKLKSGLVTISDTRIISGSQTTTAKKVFIHQREKHSLFILTSGLRSVRDKTITYFKEALEESDKDLNKLYKAVNLLADQVRKVSAEDRASLVASGVGFNFYAIVGGQLENDEEHKLYLLYPEANWVEVGKSSPFFIIGNSGYGKPILDRAIKHDSSMHFALKTGFLSFDATRLSANDVDYPIDVCLYPKDSFKVVTHRFFRSDLNSVSKDWAEWLSESINRLPDEWMNPVFGKMEGKVST